MVRKVRYEDAERLAEIYRPYVERTCFTFENTAPDGDEMLRRIKKMTAFYAWYVYEDEDGRVLGYAYNSPFRERPGYLTSADVSIYVDEKVRSRGIGRALYERLFETAAKQGILKLYAVVIDSNPVSAAFHRKMGFSLQSHFEKCGFKMGDYWGIYYMTRDLAEVFPKVPKAPVPWHEADKGE